MNISDFVILIVDDNPNNLLTLRTLLTKLQGILVLEAQSGEEALIKTLEKPIDLILLDIQMPVMDGFTTADHLKMTQRTKSIPIIFVTAVFKEEEFIQRGYELGAVDYLTKPIDDNLLLNRVQHYKSLIESQKQLEETFKDLKQATEALQTEKGQLEIRVVQRTKNLTKEIEERKKIELELIRLKEAAEEGNKMKSNFLATMSHEIRTPMNGVLGITQLLMEEELPEDVRDMINVIHYSGNALMMILNDILDYSKIEAGHLQIHEDEVDLHHLITNLSDLYKASSKAKDINLTIEISPNTPRIIIGDEVELHKIFSNLIGNAIKFTSQGSVKVNLKRIGQIKNKEVLRFEVEDTGIGIKEKDQKNIFQSFTQVDGSMQRSFGGTGLGLSISSKLTELMDGKIGIHSKEGEGSLFWVEIPFVSLKSAGSSILKPKINFPEKKEEETPVLIIEDDEVNQLVIKKMLEKLHCKVTIAENGEIGAKAAIEGNFSIVFMDCLMPVMDGFTATKLIRSLEKDRHIPIVALTAKAQSTDQEECLQAGMDDYITKPVNISILTQVVNKLLKEEVDQ